MEIKIKEIINYEEYQENLEKYLSDTKIYNKPTLEFENSIVGLAKQDIISYRILQTGMVESDKTEIKIIADGGAYIATYSKELHDELKGIIEDTEKFIEREREEKFNK